MVLASGTSFADALAAAPLAAHRGAALLLTAPTRLPDSTRNLLAQWRSAVTIVGGTAAVPQGRATDVANATGSVPTRIAGTSRYETGAAIASQLLAEGLDFAGRLWLASGTSFPDALAAGPATVRDGGVLLLVPPSGPVPGAVTDVARSSGADRIRVLGGVRAVSDGVVTEVRAALAG